MSSGDGEQGAIPPTQEKRMTEMMEALMRRQEQRFQDMMEARMTRAGAREDGDYSGQGVNIGRSSPAPYDLEVASREELVQGASANVGADNVAASNRPYPNSAGCRKIFQYGASASKPSCL